MIENYYRYLKKNLLFTYSIYLKKKNMTFTIVDFINAVALLSRKKKKSKRHKKKECNGYLITSQSNGLFCGGLAWRLFLSLFIYLGVVYYLRYSLISINN